MTVKTLYFDESGFTGYNLLDPVQPIFAVASADSEEGQASEVSSTIFPARIPPKWLTGPDIVDQMTAIIFGPHNNGSR